MAGNKKFIFCLILLALGAAAVNFFYGYAEDSDACILIRRAWKFGALGYGPSRNWGFPLYELFAYPLIYYFGIGWAKFFSFIFYLLSGLFFFDLVLYCSRDRMLAFLGATVFLVHPMAIISGNSIGESSLALFFSVAALSGLLRYLLEKKTWGLFVAALFCGLASATRQDYLMLGGAMGLTALLCGKPGWRHFTTALLLFLLGTAGPYLWMYGPDHLRHLNTEFLAYDPYWRTLVRSGLGFMTFFGWSVIVAAPFLCFRRKALPRFAIILLAFTALFYLVRFSLNADKMEYILGLLPVFLLVILLSLPSKRKVVLFLLAVFLPNLLQIHFFRREGRFTRVSFGFSPGVFVQEHSERLKQEYMFLGEHEAVLKEAAEKKFGCKKYVIYLLDVDDPELCMIVQEERLRFWNPERSAGRIDLKKAFHKRIIVYPLPDHRGWRQWIRFTPWSKPTLADFMLMPPFGK